MGGGVAIKEGGLTAAKFGNRTRHAFGQYHQFNYAQAQVATMVVGRRIKSARLCQLIDMHTELTLTAPRISDEHI
jgi:hypothetical protein